MSRFRYNLRNRRLEMEEPDRLARVAMLVELAEKTFGNREKAHRWLHKRLCLLDNRRPIDLIQTTTGRRLIEEVLAKITWGATA